jgi:hypothetical protein
MLTSNRDCLPRPGRVQTGESNGETINAAEEAPGSPGCLVVRTSIRASKRRRRLRQRYRQIGALEDAKSFYVI